MKGAAILRENQSLIKLSQLKAMSDEDLVDVIMNVDKNRPMLYLMNRYKSMVKHRAAKFFAKGMDQQDLEQEGYVGLYTAVRKYKRELGIPFSFFADTCIKGQIITAVKSSLRFKHQPLNMSVSLHKTVSDEDNNRMWMELISNDSRNPEDMVIGQEEYMALMDFYESELSSMEAKVLALYLESQNYKSVANAMGKEPKSIDNALQRIRNKTKLYRKQRKQKV